MGFSQVSMAADTQAGLCDTALRASLRPASKARGTFAAACFLKHRFGVLGKPGLVQVLLPCGLSDCPSAIPKLLSSSSLPPSFASGHRMAVFMSRGAARRSTPVLFGGARA